MNNQGYIKLIVLGTLQDFFFCIRQIPEKPVVLEAKEDAILYVNVVLP